MTHSIITHTECALIKPEFGLPFPQDARWGWGARAIYQPNVTSKPLDFLYDRQTTVWTTEPTAEQKQEFIRWINASTAFLGRALTDPDIFLSSGNPEHEALKNINRVLRNQENRYARSYDNKVDEYVGLTAEHATGRMQLRARFGGGYVYVCCWQEHVNDDHTDLWGNWFDVENKIDVRPTRNGTWSITF